MRRRSLAPVSRLHSIEAEGESDATPALALAEVLLVVIPILPIMATPAFAAYYLSQ